MVRHVAKSPGRAPPPPVRWEEGNEPGLRFGGNAVITTLLILFFVVLMALAFLRR